MRINLLVIGLLIGAIAGCSNDSSQKADLTTGADESARAISSSRTATGLPLSAVAAHPDRGELLAYEGNATAVKRGPSKWYPVKLSEEHAIRAVATGNLRVHTPEGRPLDIKYKRHVEHRNGNWTWVGEMAGAKPGREAVLTFGEKAVFGSIPYDDAEPLKLAMSGGRTWLVQTDPILAAMAHGATPTEPDFLVAASSGTSVGEAARTMSSAPPLAYSHTSTHASVDIALGYTNGLATSLGGQSQAVTRLTHLVDLTNQAYAASGVNGELRLVRTVMVDYPDATSNRTALFELTGVECTSGTGTYLPNGTLDCTSVGQPAALAPLTEAREAYGADVVSLVRPFDTAQGSCGIGWMLGGGQQEITAADAAYAMSVISDTSLAGTCREDTLAHEVGHNLGLQHDRETAQGTDDTNNDGDLLDPQEYGRYPYSFAHSTAADAGSFYTIMALRRAGQTGYLVFSNPNLTSCGGLPCGVPDQADNVRALNQTMPVVASFRASVRAAAGSDFNGDGTSDVLWRNSITTGNAIWLSANSSTSQAISSAGSAWRAVGIADFDGDGQDDILWRNSSTGGNSIWRSGSSATAQSVTPVFSQNWQVAGVADFNADGRADILWRNSSTGGNSIWLGANSATPQSIAAVSPASGWRVAGTADFDADGSADILWRNVNTGGNAIWRSANASTTQAVSAAGTSWVVGGVGDFDGDGSADIFWRNSVNGQNAVWPAASSLLNRSLTTVSSSSWQVASIGDFNNDGVSDLLWRNSSSGQNVIWQSADSNLLQSMTTVAPSSGWSLIGHL